VWASCSSKSGAVVEAVGSRCVGVWRNKSNKSLSVEMQKQVVPEQLLLMLNHSGDG